MTVGQINLSRENRFLSNSVNCTELEREKCYFSSMKGKQDFSLFTLSSPFQKGVNLIPSLKKNWGVIYQKTLGSFQGGNHILELCAFSLWPKTQEAGLLWRCWKVGTQSGDAGLFAIVRLVNHSNYWSWEMELMNWSPLYSRLHTYSKLTFYLCYHNSCTLIVF